MSATTTISTGPRRPVQPGERTDAEYLDPYRRGSASPTSTKALAGSASLGFQISLALGGEEKLTRPFIQNPWVYACCSVVARSLASLPIVVRKGVEPDAEVLDRSDPLAKLLRKPNPLTSMRKQTRLMTLYDLLWGESFLFMMAKSVGPDGVRMGPVPAVGAESIDARIAVPDEMWLVRGSVVQMVQDQDTGMPVAWRYTA